MSTPTTDDLLGAAPPAAGAAAATSLVPRCLVVLLIDVSWSIARRAESHRLVTELPRAMAALRRQPVLFTQVDLAVVTMGPGVSVVDLGGPRPFTKLPDAELPALECDGVTELGEALNVALRLIDDEVRHLLSQQRVLKVPNLVLLTDGEPTDANGEPDDSAWRAPLPELHARVRDHQLVCSAIGWREARREVLTEIAGPSAVHLGELPLAQVIRLVSGSVGRALDRFRAVKP